jgi:hypothetical protein
MRSCGAFLVFRAQNFDLDALPRPLRELSQEHVCLPSFYKEAIKLQLARVIFSEPQFTAIAQLNQAVIAAFLKVSQPLISCAKADRECLDHPPEVLDGIGEGCGAASGGGARDIGTCGQDCRLAAGDCGGQRGVEGEFGEL